MSSEEVNQCLNRYSNLFLQFVLHINIVIKKKFNYEKVKDVLVFLHLLIVFHVHQVNILLILSVFIFFIMKHFKVDKVSLYGIIKQK
jgi:hypothetical protein